MKVPVLVLTPPEETERHLENSKKKKWKFVGNFENIYLRALRIREFLGFFSCDSLRSKIKILLNKSPILT